MEQLREHKLRVIAAVAVVGFGLLQGARLLDGGSGPYSQDEFALYGLLVDGLTFLTVALLSYFAKIERPDTLFVVGVSATVAYVLLAMVGPVSVPWMLAKQTCAGISWATNILCWMYVFTCYRPRIALLMIALGYAVDAAIQPLLGDLGTVPLVFVPVYLLSVFLLWLCLRKSDAVAAAMHEPSIPKTTLQEAFSRTRRAIVATFAFSFVCGFVVESDALLAGALYSQTVLTAWMCLGVAVVMVLLLSLFRVRKVNMDYISPVAAICIATVLALRYFGVGDVAFSGGLMTATLISFYVFLWLMFVSEAFERTLPAFFLLGLALAVARLSVACGRFSALVASSVMPLDETAIIVAMMWALVITVSGCLLPSVAMWPNLVAAPTMWRKASGAVRGWRRWLGRSQKAACRVMPPRWEAPWQQVPTRAFWMPRPRSGRWSGLWPKAACPRGRAIFCAISPRGARRAI